MNTHNNNKYYKLVKIDDYVCHKFEEHLQFKCEHSSNHRKPKLTDQKIITIYLFVMHHHGIFKMNKIDLFDNEYLLSWFADLGSYQVFNQRTDRFSDFMNTCVGMFLTEFTPK